MPIGLQIIFIYSSLCFVKARLILNVKVVPNDTFKFGGERVKQWLMPWTAKQIKFYHITYGPGVPKHSAINFIMH